MTEGNFVDYVKLFVRSEMEAKVQFIFIEKNISIRRTRWRRWWPWGHIIIRANHQMWTLYKYKFKKHFSAGNGEHGSKNRKSGHKEMIVLLKFHRNCCERYKNK